MRKYHIFNPSTNPLLRWDAPALQSGTNYPSAAWFYQRESARHNAFQPILSTYYIQVKQNKLRTPETFISYIWQKQKSSIVPLLSGWRRAHSIIRWYTTVWQGRFIRSTNYFPQSGKDIDNQERKKGIYWIPFKPILRREQDSNLRTGFAGYTLSRRASSATRAPLQKLNGCKITQNPATVI